MKEPTMTLKTYREGAVLVLVNDNPKQRNALTSEFYRELPAALAGAQADPEIGAIVLTGAGDFFCAGGDLNRLSQASSLTPGERRQNIERLHDLVRGIRNSGKPVIAAVEGGAAGAGLSLALACDLVVAARNAFFAVSYIKVGLTPDAGATAFLAESCSRQLLTELCLTADRIGAERLHAFGAVNRLVDAGTALKEALALAARLADGPARATARIKALCRRAHTTTLDEQLDLEAAAMVESQGDGEAAEGIGAFLGKRKADFTALRRAGA
jgi:enoyl-CoA hydratase/carnithine racemase